MARRVLVVAAATVAVLGVAAPAGAAPRPFGPEVTAVGGCEGPSDAALAADGSLRGFASCVGTQGPAIRFFSRTAAGVVNPSVSSGFQGVVISVAQDATATYVLFHGFTTISIGKRTNAGAFSSRVVDTWGGVSPPDGDIIASGGSWLGVWTKQVGPGGEFADSELFQSGSGQSAHRITNRPQLDDLEPSLAYSGTTPVMVWTRWQQPYVPGPSDIWVAKLIGGGWQSRRFITDGTNNYSPDIATGGGLTYVTWARDGRIVVAGNSTGAFVSHTFNTPGFAPKAAVSVIGGDMSHLFLAWEARTGGTFFAETPSRDALTWQGASIAGSPTFPAAVTGYAGEATVVYGRAGGIRLLAQL